MEMLKYIEDLRDKLHRHNYLYYVKDNPEISDFVISQKIVRAFKTGPG